MKNIHILPTNKPSRLNLGVQSNSLVLLPITVNKTSLTNPQNIYITSDEQPKLDEWGYAILSKQIFKNINPNLKAEDKKKIILTDNQDLINDGVQAIDDEFLEWFVKNPSCDEIKVEKECCGQCDERLCEVYDQQMGWTKYNTFYKIIIPKEEPKFDWEYWKHRCLAAEHFIEETPCDPDIYPEQINAYNEWQKWVEDER